MGMNKFWVALVIGALATFRSYTGIDLGLTEAQITGFVTVITAIMVYLVPNLPGVSLMSLIRRIVFK